MRAQKTHHPNGEPKRNIFVRRGTGRHILKAITAAAILGLGFWFLWNRAGVTLFTFPPLTYWQALCAILLTGLLVRISMVAVGRHRGQHFHRPTPTPGSLRRCRAANGQRDI